MYYLCHFSQTYYFEKFKPIESLKSFIYVIFRNKKGKEKNKTQATKCRLDKAEQATALAMRDI